MGPSIAGKRKSTQNIAIFSIKSTSLNMLKKYSIAMFTRNLWLN